MDKDPAIRFEARLEVPPEKWALAESDLADYIRRGRVPPLTCEAIWYIGPFGTLHLDDGSGKQISYQGSMLYLACGLLEFCAGRVDVAHVSSDPVYQGAEFVVTRDAVSASVRITYHAGTFSIEGPRQDISTMLCGFVDELRSELASRLPALKHALDLDAS